MAEMGTDTEFLLDKDGGRVGLVLTGAKGSGEIGSLVDGKVEEAD